jgi:hypothetical protein
MINETKRKEKKLNIMNNIEMIPLWLFPHAFSHFDVLHWHLFLC